MQIHIKTILLFLFLLTFSTLQAQKETKKSMLFGSVVNENREKLIGATVQWEGTAIGTITDENGDFAIEKIKKDARLEIRYVGYDPVLVQISPEQDSVFIKIENINELTTVQVSEHRGDIFTSTLSHVNTEHISSCELKKAACCNLAESFETSGSVDVMKQDAVTSATEIQMLGLRGIYSQLLLEKRPTYTGLATPLALEFIPGTWVESIQVSKGTSTVQNGPQAMTGQINIELVKPHHDKPVFVNLFVATTERAESNVHLNKRWSPDFASGVLLHGSTTRGQFDRNKDRFLDQALKNTLTTLWRNVYEGENVYFQFNVQALHDERQSGQFSENVLIDPFPNYSLYLIRQKNQRIDAYGKIGYFGFEKPQTSVALIYGASLHDSQNTFDKTRYTGQQKSIYANLLYSTILGTTDHKLNTGLSFQYDDYQEFLNEMNFSRREIMPGSFAEYVFSGTHFGLIAGLRADHLSINGVRNGQPPLSKTFFTPRLNLKYNFNTNTILRLSGGRGVRSAQILAENIAVLASNRQLIVTENLQIEDAWNAGLNFTKNFKIAGRSASFIADLYRTDFVNQIVMDMESEHGKVLFYNLEGKSFSNSLLLLGTWSPFQGFDFKIAYKLNDVRTTFRNQGPQPRLRPMVAPHRALFTANYETKTKNWMFNTNVQYTGWQRFADAHHHQGQNPPPAELEHFQGYSPAYVLLNGQVTRRFKHFEVYLGGENLTDYRQQHAILDWQNPFGEYFDAMQTWGPLVGARAYLGLRWIIL